MRRALKRGHAGFRRAFWAANAFSVIYAVVAALLAIIACLGARLKGLSMCSALAIGLGVVVVGLVISLALVTLRQLRWYRVLRNLHQCHLTVHYLRDFLHNTACVCTLGEATDTTMEVGRVLDHLQEIMKSLIDGDCTTSVMLPVEEGKLRTVVWSSNVDLRRKNLGPTTLDGKGLAWKAINCGNYLVVDELQRDPDWVENSAKHRPESEYYRSGIICPFRINNVLTGVLNVDSPETFAFHQDYGPIVALAADTIGCIIGVMDVTKELEP